MKLRHITIIVLIGIWLALDSTVAFAHNNKSALTNDGTGTVMTDARPHTQYMMGFNMMDWGAASPGWLIFGWLMMIVWWAVIIGAVVLVVRALTRGGNSTGSANRSALDIIKERYAKGEIDKKEFEEMKREIEK